MFDIYFFDFGIIVVIKLVWYNSEKFVWFLVIGIMMIINVVYEYIGIFVIVKISCNDCLDFCRNCVLFVCNILKFFCFFYCFILYKKFMFIFLIIVSNV